MRLMAFGNGEPPRYLLAATPRHRALGSDLRNQKTQTGRFKTPGAILQRSWRDPTPTATLSPGKDTGSPKAETVEPGRVTRPTRCRVFACEARTKSTPDPTTTKTTEDYDPPARPGQKIPITPKGNFVCHPVRSPK
jgi:hypothetical protein